MNGMRLRERFRTALVTGAASGLGAAFVSMLAAEGVEVWGTSRRRERVPDREGFHGLALELADVDSIARAWEEVERASGGVDLVINNAGEGVFAAFLELTDAEHARQIEVLLCGPAALARRALRHMSARGGGCLVNVTSIAGEFPVPYLAAYSAAKAGLSALTAAMLLESGHAPVRLIDFRPGDYRTRFNEAMRPPADDPAQARARRVWNRLEALLRRAPTPDRAARDLRAALLSGRCGIVRSGSLFQAGLAPFLQRFASQGLSRRVQRRYFELPEA